MVKHNLIQKYFHGCGECRNCCNGKLFSMGQVTFSDFKKIIKLFPTIFDETQKRFLFLYSLAPMVGCHYFREGECSIYGIIDRPDTCKNFPFGIYDQTINADYTNCPTLNDTEGDFPILNDNGSINPRVMNEFFTEYQYISHLREDNKILDDFVDIVFESGSLKKFPKFKTLDGEIIDIKEIDANKDLMVLDIEKISKLIRKMDNQMYESFVYGHLFSLEHLPRFGQRLLQQI